MPFEDILFEKRDGVAWITINRPQVRNAFRAHTVDELVVAFRDAWAILISVCRPDWAGDRAFCSGGDQKDRTTTGYGKGEGIGLDVVSLHSVIRNIPKPVIAMVNGYAIGGGHVLHVICDLSIAADTAIFGQTGPRVGSVDPGFGTAYLARIIARSGHARSGTCAASNSAQRHSRWAWLTESSSSAVTRRGRGDLVQGTPGEKSDRTQDSEIFLQRRHRSYPRDNRDGLQRRRFVLRNSRSAGRSQGVSREAQPDFRKARKRRPSTSEKIGRRTRATALLKDQ